MTGLKQIQHSSSCLGPPAAKHSSRSASCTGQWLASREAASKLLSNSCLSEAGFVPEAGRFVCFKSYLTMDVFIIHIHVTLLCTLRRTRRKAVAFLSPSAEQTALISHVPVAFQSQLPVTLTLFNKTKGSGGAVFPQHPSAFYQLLLQHHKLLSDSYPLSVSIGDLFTQS